MQLPGPQQEPEPEETADYILKDSYLELAAALQELDGPGQDFSDPELLTQCRWREVYPEGEFHPPLLFVFREKNHLLYIEKGNVFNGKWEILLGNASLILEYANDLNHKRELYDLAFFEEGILILRKHGSTSEHPLGKYLVLVDESRYPDENLDDILEELPERKKSPLPWIAALILLLTLILLLYRFLG